MQHGLAMQSSELHPLSTQTALRLIRVETAQIVVALAQLVAGRLVGGCRVQPRLQRLWKFRLPVFQKAHAAEPDVAHRVVHGINARAGHDAEHEQRFFL